MGEKAEFLIGEGLISTAFLGGIWTAAQANPESILINVLGQVLAEFVGPETASSYVLMGEIMLFVGFLVVVGGVYLVGRKIGLVAFGITWLSGYLFVQGISAGVYLLLLGWGLGVLAIKVHTDETIGSPAGRGYNGL